jgi:hypothetical protein
MEVEKKNDKMAHVNIGPCKVSRQVTSTTGTNLPASLAGNHPLSSSRLEGFLWPEYLASNEIPA